MNILRSKKHTILQWIVTGLVVLTGCSPNEYDDPVPYQPFPDIALNLNLPENVQLKSKGSTQPIGGGVRGIIIYCVDPGVYHAYERNCTYHPNDACATVNVDNSKLFFIDPCCGSTFDFSTGDPIGGVAIRPLVQYKTSFDGVILSITDDVIN